MPWKGILFPATYPFYEEKPYVETVVDEMIQATVSNMSPYLDYLEGKEKTVHWLLTFASLLEKEATQNQTEQQLQVYFTTDYSLKIKVKK